jgi:SAM-dependent methyltransferase
MSARSLLLALLGASARLRASVTRRMARFNLGGPCTCVYCGQRSWFFLPYSGGIESAPPVVVKLDVVGSDLDHCACPKCESSDRERHLKLYCQRFGIDQRVTGARILHFAPERQFSAYIVDAGPSRYVKADLFPSGPDVEKINMLDIAFSDESFDMVIANHVLEHVSDDAKALAEIRRVLRPGGLAILQTPFSAMLVATFEDTGVASKTAREHAYGQDDHVRLYGADIFSRFSAAGFVSRVAEHDACLNDVDSRTYGVNRREPFFLFERI